MLMRLNSSVTVEKRTRGGERLLTERRAPPPTIKKGVSVKLGNLVETDVSHWNNNPNPRSLKANDPIRLGLRLHKNQRI
jgi:hypothetical protein